MRCAAATSERETDREDLVMRPPLMARHRGRPLQFRSMIAGFPLPPTEILTGALVDPVEALIASATVRFIGVAILWADASSTKISCNARPDHTFGSQRKSSARNNRVPPALSSFDDRSECPEGVG
jgi:hypothetical protein